MGTSSNPEMLFNLSDLIEPVSDLDTLVDPFQRDEIDQIVKRMPSDKAPGPDGFNAHFLKKCWHLLKNDFYSLCC